MQPQTSHTKTRKTLLPYQMIKLPSGRIQIKNTRGHVLIISRDQIVLTLRRTDLSVHERRKYEAALQVSNEGMIF